jgi:hypothetical protein
MATFTTRVELRGLAKKQDYAALNKAMVQAGFRRTVVNEQGKVYHLPEAEFDLVSDKSCVEVRDLAASIAAQVWRNYLVLVTEAAQRSWLLVLVKTDAALPGD